MSIDKIVYHGGPIIKNAQLCIIFWGSNWNEPALATSANQFVADLRQLLAGPYMLGLSQYGGIGPASVLSTSVDSSSEPATPMTLDGLAAYVQPLISNGKVPDFRSNDQILYLVVTNGVQADSPDIGGFHYWGTIGNETFHVAWVDDTDTAAASHEIVEACTDPEGNGYYQGEIEVADICEDNSDAFGFSDGILAASYWSNTDGTCILPVRTANITCSLDDCRVGPAQGGYSTLQVASYGTSPAWLDASKLSPLASPMYQWKLPDVTTTAVGPTNQSSLQVQWAVSPGRYLATIDVTVIDEPGISIKGAFHAFPVTKLEAEILEISCHFRRFLGSINRIPPFLINPFGPDPALLPTEREIERLRSIVGVLAKDVEHISTLTTRLREEGRG